MGERTEAKQNSTETERDGRLSLLRLLATLAVIWGHIHSTIADNSLFFGANAGQLRFHARMFYPAIWSVGVFFMLTGALLLPVQKEYRARTILRYIRRAALALLLFGMAFSACRLYLGGTPLGAGLLWTAFLSVLTGEAAGHLWYLYVLLGLYLLLPLLRAYVSAAGQRTQGAMLLVLFCLTSVLPWLNTLLGERLILTTLVAYPVLYLLLGSFLHTALTEAVRERCAGRLRLAALAGLLLGFAGILYYSGKYVYPYSGKYISFDSPYIIAMAAAVFLLLRLLPPREWMRGRLFWQLDRLSFTAYLIHPFLIQLLYRYFGIIPVRYKSDAAVSVLLWAAVALLSYGLAALLKLVPPLRKYVL